MRFTQSNPAYQETGRGTQEAGDQRGVGRQGSTGSFGQSSRSDGLDSDVVLATYSLDDQPEQLVALLITYGNEAATLGVTKWRLKTQAKNLIDRCDDVIQQTSNYPKILNT